MGRRLILDTCTVIEALRGTLTLDGDDEIAVAAITQAELAVGPLRHDDPDRAQRERELIDAFLDAVIVLDYTPSTAEKHADLISHTRRSGRPRGAHDLIIAAHAAETGRVLVSDDRHAWYGDLPGVRAA